MARTATATKDALLDAAERLVAEHGIGGLSLRAVAATAAARNTSAAAYHFGTRDELLDALFERRMAPINERRLAMLADAGGRAVADLPTLVRALVEPLVAALDAGPGPSHYAVLPRRVPQHPGGRRSLHRARPTSARRPAGGHRRTVPPPRRAARAGPQPARRPRGPLRRDCAGRLRMRPRRPTSRRSLPAVLASMLVDSIVAMLSAPMSDRTIELVERGHRKDSQ